MKKQLLALTACSLVLAGCSNSDTPKTTEAAPTTSHSIPVPKTSVENKTPLADTDVGFLGLQAPEGAVDIHRHSFNEYDPSVIEAFPHLRQYEPEIHRWMGNFPISHTNRSLRRFALRWVKIALLGRSMA